MKYLAIIPFLMLGFIACTQPVMKVIGVKEAKELLAAKDPNLQIVDLRTPAEIKQTGIIEGAAIMDFNAPDFDAKVKQLSKKRPVLLYCAAGGRSAAAAQQLHQQGFRTVYDMSPGMSGWLSSGNKTVKQ
ncbi:MAG TPA: rhodanese-like domain-containing protein [Saprospiraceae bacterium]|nr:rhodanese-like domain-containing protein [Saprospiraceae bacterium]